MAIGIYPDVPKSTIQLFRVRVGSLANQQAKIVTVRRFVF
jgi:hypothetical protein